MKNTQIQSSFFKLNNLNIHNLKIGDLVSYNLTYFLNVQNKIVNGEVIYIDDKGYYFTIDTGYYKTSIHFLDRNYKKLKKELDNSNSLKT